MIRCLLFVCLCFLGGCSFMNRMWNHLAFWRDSEPETVTMASMEPGAGTQPAPSEIMMQAELGRLEDQRRALDERIGALKTALAANGPAPMAATPMVAAAPPPPAPARPPAVAAATAPAAPAGGSDLFSDLQEYSVHLASYRGVSAAARGWHELKQKLSKELDNLQPRVVAVDFNDGRGTFYRLKAGPFPNKKSAVDRCDEIKAAGNFCHVEDFTGQNLGGKG